MPYALCLFYSVYPGVYLYSVRTRLIPYAVLDQSYSYCCYCILLPVPGQAILFLDIPQPQTFRSRSVCPLQFLRMQSGEWWEISSMIANQQRGFCNRVDPKRLGWNYVSQDPTQWSRQLEDLHTVLVCIRYPWYIRTFRVHTMWAHYRVGEHENKFWFIIVSLPCFEHEILYFGRVRTVNDHLEPNARCYCGAVLKCLVMLLAATSKATT